MNIFTKISEGFFCVQLMNNMRLNIPDPIREDPKWFRFPQLAHDASSLLVFSLSVTNYKVFLFTKNDFIFKRRPMSMGFFK